MLPERIVACLIAEEIKDHWRPTNPHDNQCKTYKSLSFFTTRKRPLIAYWPTSHHRAARNRASQPAHSPPDPYLVEEESLYFSNIPASIYLKKQIKSNPLCNILICMQKHSQHNKDERTHFFIKIYLSLYSKGLRKGYCVRGELETEQNCNILTPSSSGYRSTSFSSCGTAQPEALGAQLFAGFGSQCFELQQLTPNSDLQLTRTSCSTGLYNYLTSTCFSERRICTEFNPSTVKVIPWYLPPDALAIYTGAFLIWQLGWVGGQYVTSRLLFLATIRLSITVGTEVWLLLWNFQKFLERG